jgi:ABC-2 type transport system ATP-binding protein
VPFAEVAVHRSTLEEGYMELTRDAVQFRAAEPEATAHTTGSRR